MRWGFKDIRDVLAFLLGTSILVHELVVQEPPLDRQWLLAAGVTLVLFGLGKFNGRHGPIGGPWSK